MSQATLTDRPYVNSNLFSGHYLDERLRDRDDIADGLERYIEAKERAEGSDEKTDELIDEIVYERYGLTDEGIEIIESAVE